MLDHKRIEPSQQAALVREAARLARLGRACGNDQPGAGLIGLEIGVHLQAMTVACLDGDFEWVAQFSATQLVVLPALVAALGWHRVAAVAVAVVAPAHASDAQLLESLHHGVEVLGADRHRGTQSVIGEIHECLDPQSVALLLCRHRDRMRRLSWGRGFFRAGLCQPRRRPGPGRAEADKGKDEGACHPN